MSKAWKNILSGIAVIAIGLFMGGSIFTGDADIIDIVFDVIGIVLILVGVIQLVSSGDAEKPPPAGRGV